MYMQNFIHVNPSFCQCSRMSAFQIRINLRRKPNVQFDETKTQFDLHVNSNNYTYTVFSVCHPCGIRTKHGW